jgi:hypothetical protein
MPRQSRHLSENTQAWNETISDARPPQAETSGLAKEAKYHRRQTAQNI